MTKTGLYLILLATQVWRAQSATLARDSGKSAVVEDFISMSGRIYNNTIVDSVIDSIVVDGKEKFVRFAPSRTRNMNWAPVDLGSPSNVLDCAATASDLGALMFKYDDECEVALKDSYNPSREQRINVPSEVVYISSRVSDKTFLGDVIVDDDSSRCFSEIAGSRALGMEDIGMIDEDSLPERDTCCQSIAEDFCIVTECSDEPMSYCEAEARCLARGLRAAPPTIYETVDLLDLERLGTDEEYFWVNAYHGQEDMPKWRDDEPEFRQYIDLIPVDIDPTTEDSGGSEIEDIFNIIPVDLGIPITTTTTGRPKTTTEKDDDDDDDDDNDDDDNDDDDCDDDDDDDNDDDDNDDRRKWHDLRSNFRQDFEDLLPVDLGTLISTTRHPKTEPPRTRPPKTTEPPRRARPLSTTEFRIKAKSPSKWWDDGPEFRQLIPVDIDLTTEDYGGSEIEDIFNIIPVDLGILTTTTTRRPKTTTEKYDDDNYDRREWHDPRSNFRQDFEGLLPVDLGTLISTTRHPKTEPPRTRPPKTTEPPRTRPPTTTEPPKRTRPPTTTEPPKRTRPPTTTEPLKTRPPTTTLPLLGARPLSTTEFRIKAKSPSTTSEDRDDYSSPANCATARFTKEPRKVTYFRTQCMSDEVKCIKCYDPNGRLPSC